MRKQHVPVAVIGAGPYGLSVSAHLAAQGARPAVFGRPMDSWRHGAPPSMRLKSEGFASSLSDPGGEFTLKAFCRTEGLPYADMNLPTPIATFVAYGDAFQKRYAPQLDTRHARQIRQAGKGFEIELEDGETLTASQCVIATGLSQFDVMPPALRGLERVRHTAQLSDYSVYAGARALVVGAGASATNAAGELLRQGAEVTLTCRNKTLWFPEGGKARGWRDALRAPQSPVGPGWSKWGVCRFPGLFHALPEALRVRIVDNTLGPAPAWYVRDEIQGKIELLAGRTILAARETRQGVEVDMVDHAGERSTHVFDQVIAGAGYRVDVERLTFLSPLLGDLARVGGSPRLSRDFETSVPGLYFVGVAAAYAFGPAFRFVCGAEYASRRVSAAISVRLRNKAPQSAADQPNFEVAALNARSRG